MNKKIPFQDEGIRRFYCPICGQDVELFTKVHVEKHGHTKESFLQAYPQFSDDYYWGTLGKHITKSDRKGGRK